MTAEPLSYRARKWVIQQISTRVDQSDQHRRIIESDWDIVVVLDACRWDTLQSVADWPIDYARSPASSTRNWLDEAESNGIFEGLNVATGNVQYEYADIVAANIAKLWETDWQAELGTVLPGPVLERADAFLREDDRPVLAHVLPPHAPYVAKIGEKWLPAFPDTVAWNQNPDSDDGGERISAQVAMSTGQINLGRAKKAYRASVASTWEVVAQYIGRWVESGYDVILTADHGETFGRVSEYLLYGHPDRCHVKSLVKVPFERFTPGASRKPQDVSTEDKLRALGYVS